MIKLEDVLEFIKENASDADVMGAIAEQVPTKVETPEITVDLLKELAETDSRVKSWLDSERDIYTNKAIETWKQNNLRKEVEAKIKEIYPEEEVENIKLRELEARLASMEAEKNREIQRNLALLKSQEMGIPTSVVDYVIGTSDDETLENLSVFADAFAAAKEQTAKSVLKDSSYTPPRGSSEKVLTVADLTDESTPEEINAVFDNALNSKD